MGLKDRRGNHHINDNFDINVTPFVDVLFVLLIIFMVATPIVMGGMNVNLPQGNAKIIVLSKEPIAVTIQDDGRIYVNKTPVKLRLLPQKLLDVSSGDMDVKVFVRGDAKLDYGRVIKVAGVINSAGFTNVVLVTDIKG